MAILTRTFICHNQTDSWKRAKNRKSVNCLSPFMDSSKLLGPGTYGFEQNIDEPCVYELINEQTVVFLVLYVDDILLIENNVRVLTDVKNWLAEQFQMKDLGDASYVLGIQIIRDRKNRLLALSQASYIDKVLARFSMQNSKKGLLPTRHGISLSKQQCPKTP